MPSICLLLSLALASVAKGQNAFPGAVGFGAIATGGNNGTTFHVTTLADSGTGSLREAVSVSHRNIVFDVGGYIVLESPLALSSSITINGQTAPAPGIGVMAAGVSASGQENIIIRHFRMRQGTLDHRTGKSAFNMGKGTNIILDHCSIAYGQWNNIGGVGVNNITISNSIIAFPIGQQFGAHIEGTQATYHGNLWVSGHNRQPLSKANTQYINNVVYNYRAAYTVAGTGGAFTHDLVNNYFIAGPSTTRTSNYFFQFNAEQRVYSAGNYVDGDRDGVLGGTPTGPPGGAVELHAPWAADTPALANRTAAAAYADVLAGAGAAPRDELDAFAVETVQSLGRAGKIYKDQAETGLNNGGYPVGAS